MIEAVDIAPSTETRMFVMRLSRPPTTSAPYSAAPRWRGWDLLSGERELCTRGHFVMIALDADGQPTAVPPL